MPIGKLQTSAARARQLAVTIENSELRHCYDRPVKSQNAEVVVRDSWIHHNLRGGPFACRVRPRHHTVAAPCCLASTGANVTICNSAARFRHVTC